MVELSSSYFTTSRLLAASGSLNLGNSFVPTSFGTLLAAGAGRHGSQATSAAMPATRTNVMRLAIACFELAWNPSASGET